VEDCGTIINPQLVDEQIRGGVVQGLGGALFEHCLYDERGQMLNGNMADYLVPMAAEMPDIEIGHVVSPTADSETRRQGRGRSRHRRRTGRGDERGQTMPLRPLGAQPIATMPLTPEVILRAFGASLGAPGVNDLQALVVKGPHVARGQHRIFATAQCRQSSRREDR